MHDIGLNIKLYCKILKDMRFHICIQQIYNTEFSNNRCILYEGLKLDNYRQFRIPVKSNAFSVRVTLQGIKSRSRAHPRYCHANTKIDELENFNKHNKTT